MELLFKSLELAMFLATHLDIVLCFGCFEFIAVTLFYIWKSSRR